MFGQPQIEIKARIDAEGSVTARAIGSCSYGGRTATVDTDITDKKALAAIGSALTGSLSKDEAAELRQDATAAAAESFGVAHKKGEKV